jgi:RNA polymerase sigma-70 factor (ECF subfamily)
MYADLSFKQISELTGVSINTSLGRMRYALLNLRKMIADNQMVLR